MIGPDGSYPHLTEGWLLFLVSLALIAIWAVAVRQVERWRFRFGGAAQGGTPAPIEVAP